MRLTEAYRPFPKQQEFHDSLAKYRLFGGAAGPGKTRALLWEAVFQVQAFAGAEALLLRRTFPELEMSLLKEWRQNVPWRKMGVKYNESSHTATFPNKSILRFGYCANENDVYQYQGAEFLFIGIDELTLFTLKMWQFLTSRNRCPIPDSFPCMAGATNPGNIGHAWVKSLWIEKQAPAGFEKPELYDATDYAFVRATLEDNPIYANDMQYRKSLEVLPTHLRQAFLHGDWEVFSGQYFDIFSTDAHVARRESVQVASYLPRWVSIDWGFEHPSAVYWHVTAPDGKTITYREFVQNRLTPRMLAQAIVERCEKENITEVFLSPDAFAHRTSEASIAEQIGDILAAHKLPRPAPADDDRVGGWQLMYELLRTGEWIISDACQALIKNLPSLVRDNKKPEDIAKTDGDDPADAARYGLKSRIKLIRKPFGVRVQEKITANPQEDLTSYHIQRIAAEAEEKKKAKPIRFRSRYAWRH